MYKILLIEDDAVIAAAVQKHLAAWGYEVQCAADFADIIPQFVAYAPQLVLLDISLPFYNGYHWCTEIRRVSSVPILFLSSAADNMSMVMAMNMGGDDFVAKPFDVNVLTAKVQALLRRAYAFGAPAALLQKDGAILNTADATLQVDGVRVELTKNEYKILQLLLENKGKTVRREEIMARLWETDSFIDDNTLTVNVTRLRKKLAAAGRAELIRTQKGVGYIVG